MASRRNSKQKSNKSARKTTASHKRKAQKPRKRLATKAPANHASKIRTAARDKRPALNAKTDSANDPQWIAPVWDDDVLLGAHVSTAGGTQHAPPRARAIGA